MADYSDLTSGIFEEPEKAEPKPTSDSGPDFSGLSFKEIASEEPVTEAPMQGDMSPATMTPDESPRAGQYAVGADPAFPDAISMYRPSIADFDSDAESVLEYITENGGDIFQAGLVGQIGATEADIGRRMQQKEAMLNIFEGEKEDASYWDKLKASVAMMNPLSTLITLAGGSPFAFAEEGAEAEQRGKAVRDEAKADLQEAAEKADTTGKRIAFDVISSAAATAPALATAPLGSPLTTLVALGSTAYFDTTQEAYEKTGDLVRARQAGFIDAFIEAGTEKIPLTTLFNMGQGKSLVKDVLKFLVQEEGTEIAATALQDLNAKLMYDPDMTWEQALDNIARTALSTPFSAGLQAGGMHAVQAVTNKTQQKVGEMLRNRMPAPFTPFSEEVLKSGQLSEAKRQEIEQIQEKLNQIMGEVSAELATNMPDEETYASLEKTFPLRDESFTAASGGENVTNVRTVENFLGQEGIIPTRNNKVIPFQAIQPGEVVLAKQPAIYETAVKNFRAIQESQDRLEALLDERGAPLAERKVWRKNFESRIENARKEVAHARKLESRNAAKLSKAQDLIQTWVKKYAPDMKVVLHTMETPGVGGQAYGHAADTVIPIWINLDNHAISAKNIASRNRKAGAKPILAPSSELNETLAHEFGHALLGYMFAKQPDVVQAALRADWQQFLNMYQNSTTHEISPEIQRAYASRFMAGPSRPLAELMREKPGTFKHYLPNFAEFLAHRMARAEGYSETTQSFFKDAKRTVEKYWKNLPSSQKFDKSFELFLEKLAKEAELTRVKAEYEGRVRRYRAALDAMRDTASTAFMDTFSGGGNTVVPPTTGDHWGERDGRTQRVNSSIDKFNSFIKLTAGLTHISDMNKHIPGIENYMHHAQELWQDKMRWTSAAMDVMRDWVGSEYAKSAAEREQLAKFLFEADRRSELKEGKLDQDEMAELREEFGINNDMYSIAERVWSTFDDALTQVEEAIVADLQNQLTEGNPAQIAETLREVRRDFANMRNRNYMPHSRFGSYTVTGFAQEAMTLDDVEYKRGQTVFFGSYATEKDALNARAELEREYGSGVRFGVGLVEDNVRELLDLPPALAQLIESKLNLDAKQQKELTELRAILAPGQSFRKRFVERAGTPGYSEDAPRVFSDYMQKFAGHLSRIKHVPRLEAAIQLMEDSARGIRQQGGNSVKRERIIQWYKDHLDYLLDPGNELAGIRAVGFLWYLGFSPKSAIVNATQVPMITLPYLAQEYNDVSAAAAISDAIYQVTKAQFTEKGMDPEAARMVEELIQRGIIDESLATELAALSEGGFLARAPGTLRRWARLDSPESTLKIHKFFEWGALLFQSMEKMNRRITAVAAYKLARKSGDSHEVAVDKAHKAIVQTQYEYARFNRPEMMRGPIKSNVFMFWQYITNTLWFLGQNKGAAARYMLIMFALGGLEGLPFASNILDLLDFATKKLKGMIDWTDEEKMNSNWSDPKYGAREFLWDLTSQLDDDPILSNVMNSHTLMNGYSSRMFGMYDLSASIQMGRILPGTEYLATDLNTKTEVLGGMAQLAGATINIPLSIIQAVWSDEPDLWKRVERGLPQAASSISAATRYAVRGEEVDRRGAEIASFTWPDDPTSWAEIMGRASGFQLTRVTEERDKRFASYDAIQYWTKRHNGLTTMLNYAYDQGDEERMSEALDAIVKFNKQVPFPEMMIQTRSITRSMKEAEKRRIMREMGIAEQKKYIRLQQDVEGRRGGGEE